MSESWLATGKRRVGTVARKVFDQYSALRYLKERDVLAVSVIGLFDYMSIYVIIPFLPLFLDRMQVSPVMIGFIFAAEPLMMAVLSAPSGALSDRIGRKAPIVVGTLVSGLSVFALGFASTALVFILLRAIDGAAGALRAPATQAYIGDRFPKEERGQAVSAHKTLKLSGVAIGPAFGGLVAARTGVSATFMLLGAITFVGSIVSWPLLQTSLPQRDAEGSDRNLLQSFSRAKLRQVASIPVISLAITSFVSALSIGAFEPILRRIYSGAWI